MSRVASVSGGGLRMLLEFFLRLLSPIERFCEAQARRKVADDVVGACAQTNTAQTQPDVGQSDATVIGVLKTKSCTNQCVEVTCVFRAIN